MFSRIKGAADNFFEMPLWSGIRKKIEDYVMLYNFVEIEIPILEYVSLFQRGLGMHTDVVSKEMFLIQSKNVDDVRDQICLRPEATAGTMRAFLEQKNSLNFPCKVFTYGPMFRYERPQKGRMRQFHQMNLEVIGAQTIAQDILFIKMLHTLFSQQLKLNSFILKLNFLGQAQDRKNFCQQLVKYVEPKKLEMCNQCQTRLESNPLRMLDCKSLACQTILKNGPKLANFFSEQTQALWKELCDGLHELSVSFVHDPHLVRGLDYYNNTAFEFVSIDLGAQNTFCGGGRYDSLAEQLGSAEQIPALGCAIGMERLVMMLEKQKDDFIEKQKDLICIIPFEQNQNMLALHLTDMLIENEQRVEVLVDDQKLKQKMKKANQLNARFVLLIGPDEQKEGMATLKDMKTGNEKSVLQIKVLEEILKAM